MSVRDKLLALVEELKGITEAVSAEETQMRKDVVKDLRKHFKGRGLRLRYKIMPGKAGWIQVLPGKDEVPEEVISQGTKMAGGVFMSRERWEEFVILGGKLR